MKINFLDLKKNYSSIENEIDIELKNLFKNCDFILGEKVKQFENNFANYLDIKYFIGCGNGTDALEIAINCLDLNKDDEVIVQGNTYIASCLGVLNNNIKLVLCDIDHQTNMIDLDKLKFKITNKTKALIVVHLYGLVPNMDNILNICNENNLYLIEDCAQAHGALWKNKKVGSFGDISCFSFYPGKNLGAFGDGGGIGTNNNIFNERIRKIANLGCKVKYQHELIGRNSRLDTIQACILNIKLKYLDECNIKRRNNAELYKKYLFDIKNIELPKYDSDCTPVFHLYVIKTDYRDELKKYLEDKNITCLIHYPISISETDALAEFKFKDVDNCIKNSKKILSLPMYPELTEDEIIYVCNNINNFFMEKNLLLLENVKTLNKPGILHYINNFNFDLKRLFYVDSFNDIKINYRKNFYENGQEYKIENNKRGFHANINFDELVFILNGEINIKLIDKNLNITEKKLFKNDIYLIPRMKWLEYEILTEKTIMLVLVNETLYNSKGIFNFEEFKNF